MLRNGQIWTHPGLVTLPALFWGIFADADVQEDRYELTQPILRLETLWPQSSVDTSSGTSRCLDRTAWWWWWWWYWEWWWRWQWWWCWRWWWWWWWWNIVTAVFCRHPLRDLQSPGQRSIQYEYSLFISVGAFDKSGKGHICTINWSFTCLSIPKGIIL